MKEIISLNNTQIKGVIRLKTASRRRESGLILIDGFREIELAARTGLQLVELYYCPEIASRPASALGASQQAAIQVSPAVMAKLAYKENPDGWLAVAKRPEKSLDEVKVSKQPLIVILERVEKPGNLGAIIRTAAAVSADAVIVNEAQTDIYNPNIIRASEGLIFSQNVISAGRKETAQWLKEKKIKSFAASTGASQTYTTPDYTGPTAIVLGSEAAGLGPEWLEAADELIRIPMAPGLDSLNVSVSAAVILFEAKRQRGN